MSYKKTKLISSTVQGITGTNSNNKGALVFIGLGSSITFTCYTPTGATCIIPSISPFAPAGSRLPFIFPIKIAGYTGTSINAVYELF